MNARTLAFIAAAAFLAMAPALGFMIGRIAPSARIVVTTHSGNAYVAGEGDTCTDAWRFVVLPDNVATIVCE